MMIRIWILSILFSVGCNSPQKNEDPQRILNIFHTNDIHSHLVPNTEGRGGLAYLASVLNVIKAQEPEALILDAGDFYNRGNLPAARTNDLVAAEVREMLPQFDLRAVGNNEVKLGVKRLTKWSKDFEHSSLISANLVDENGELIFPPYKILKKGDLKVGIIGLTVDFPVDPKENVKILSPEATIEKYVSEVRPKVDVLILLSHINYKRNLKFLEKFRGIDLIVSGHSHFLPSDQRSSGTPIVVEAGGFAEQLGVVRMIYDKSLKKLVSIDSTVWPIGKSFQIPDPKVDAKIMEAFKKFAPDANEVLFKVKSKFIRVCCEDQRFEGSLNNFVADVLKDSVGADVSAVNRLLITDEFPPGEITKDKFNLAFPHKGRIAALKMERLKFQNLMRETVENGFKTMAYVPFSFSGATLYLKTKDDIVERVKVNVQSKNKLLKVALPEYVATHCDEFFPKTYCPLEGVSFHDEINTRVLQKFTSLKEASPPPLNRVGVAQ